MQKLMISYVLHIFCDNKAPKNVFLKSGNIPDPSSEDHPANCPSASGGLGRVTWDYPDTRNFTDDAFTSSLHLLFVYIHKQNVRMSFLIKFHAS